MIETHHDYRGYVFSIAYVPDDPAYLVAFADFPEVITHGESRAGAFANACEALDLHLESLAKLGKQIPKPRHRLVVSANEK